MIHSQCEFFSFQFAQHIAKHTGAPIVHTLYEEYVTYVIPTKSIGKRMVGKLSRMRLKRVRSIIAPTGKVKDALLGYGVKNEIQIVPSGISLEQHNQRLSKEQRKRKRRTLGIQCFYMSV